MPLAVLLCTFLPPAALPQDPTSANASRSVVTINKLSATGRSDTALGFVIAKNQVATAFQAIDSTLRLEVVFLDGRKVITQDIWACDRLKDWALIKVDTGNTPALARMEGADLSNAGHYLIFNLASNDTRTIAAVEIAGRHTLPAFGDRIQIQPPPSNEAVGGPLLTSAGLVAGILGGSITPGSRLIKETEIAATPIGVVPVLSGGKPARLEVLLDSGVLTPPLVVMQSLVSGGMARSISKGSDGVTTKDAAEFSRGDAVAWIYTFWQKKDKASKGEVSAQVYDARNISIVDLTPQTVSLPEAAPTLVDFKIALQKFKPGDYRVDVLWNEKPAFRTFFTIVAEPRP
ncbi:MAG TPA: trypsin-like peptidase domain-containing protein [Bryobacteraceae bacterium]|nr:trypsin-like peptidase domain-containing protein [Bryobacteraceae bacterium]